ncbi:MAG: hypothetical protein ACYC5A_06820 [Thermoleophilia bacterium]
MSVDVIERDLRSGAAWRLGGWLSLAAVPYLAWKLMVAELSGSLGGALAALLAALALLAGAILFIAGLVMGTSAAEGRTRSRPAAVAVATWMTIGLMADTVVGLLAASYLSQIASSLGDAQAGGFWTDIDTRDALLFILFSLGGGIAGATAAIIYRSRA